MAKELEGAVSIKSPAEFIAQLASRIRARLKSDAELVDVLDTYVLKENAPADAVERATAAIVDLAQRRAQRGSNA